MRLACAGFSSWLEKRATIVTPSPVLAAAALQQFSASRLEQHLESWERPPIYSIGAWLTICWQEARYRGHGVPTLLSTSQELVLWQHIIEQEQPELFDVNAAALLARRASKTIAEWRIPLESDLWNDHQDAQQFLLWRKIFSQRCREEGWITRSDIWGLLPLWIAKSLCAPGPAVFVGFTSLPALQCVKQAFDSLASSISFESRSAAPAPVKACDDFNQELEHAARWARAMFEQQPGRSIGIFVPDLLTHRAVVERAFERILYPSSTPGDECVFHINAAAPLENHPLVASALLVLKLARFRIDVEDACAILRCSFIKGAAAERGRRALADLNLRKRRQLEVTLHDLALAAWECPVLARLLQDIPSAPKGKSRWLEPAAWSNFMGDLLEAMGWPGDLELTLQEQAVVDAWKNALSGLAALGLVSPPVSFEIALSHLRRLLSKGNLQRGDWPSPIQILDASDAPGLEFDCAFVTGLGSETWPKLLDASPLVPLKLQRAQGVPGASGQSIAGEKERLTRALFQAAPVVFGTHSGRLSGVAEPFVTKAPIEFPGWKGNSARQSYTPATLNEIEDTNAPPYRDNGETRGGAGVIKCQSLCSFRAFAEYRLNAASLDDACLGIDSRDRGGFVHKALEKIWPVIRTQEQLISMPLEELQTLVRAAVEEAVRDRDSSPFDKLAAAMERDRLEALVLDWLQFERTRKQSFTVESVEDERDFSLAGLRLHLRVDRIDRLKNGKLILIDYKSGKQSRRKLECPRPVEPQLLVYAAAVGTEVEGVFFGEIKARDLRAVGFSRQRHFTSKSAELVKDWDAFLDESRQEVERLAQEFVAGNAAVDRVRGACTYCCLAPLCRVNEGPQGEQDEE
ncbi:MAG: PD-(D/E)XK nuclease family protein [Bryobacteraceae bacterium]